MSNAGKRTLREGTVCEGKSAIQPGAKWLELLAQSAPSTKARSNRAPIQSVLDISSRLMEYMMKSWCPFF